ncbi:DAK2 domain-containing protein [Selenomonas sputigena]|uniref:DAK2 domain-containing protein n=1 Tax=Selenomonas sputigena TaxID=69823 RepID=A0ABV3X4P9_9FIRM
MTGNREIITGSDFKRMLSGAYGELLLEYESIDELSRQKLGERSALPGTHVLRTMGAAVMPLVDVKDESIGGLARRVASAAVLGARGTTGVVLGQLLRGLAKGLSGKSDATSSEFGKAFQYGILYAQRVLPPGTEAVIVSAAKAVAKGAHHAVRANLPISEILQAAIAEGTRALAEEKREEPGARVMQLFLQGCMKGLDGHFVSPAVSLSLGMGADKLAIPDPRKDLVRPYCVSFSIVGSKARVREVEHRLQESCRFVVVEPGEGALHVHVHTDHPGSVVEQAIGWGRLHAFRLINMSEAHSLTAVYESLMPVALLAVASSQERGLRLTELGANVIVPGSRTACPSVADLLHAAHSDLARTYVLVSADETMALVLRQAKRILGERVELVLARDEAEQEKAVAAYDKKRTARENAKAMRKLLV